MQDPNDELMSAIRSNDINNKIEAIKYFLDIGANPNYIDISVNPNYPTTPLFLAVTRGDVEIINTLLEAGADPNFQGSQLPPLHMAVILQNIYAVNALLDAGADPNYQDRIGQTPLMEAIRYDDLNIAELLLDRGADPKIKMLGGMSALDQCTNHQNPVVCLRLMLDREKDAFKTQYYNSLQMLAKQYSGNTQNKDPWLLILLNEKLKKFCDDEEEDEFKYLGALWGLAEILDLSYVDLMFNKSELCDRLKEKIKTGL